ncbi:hypothetical protein HZA98_05280 [Candidatus Woesearchaeota archaeon]|nr:hypothetical protein [Candidatus Woesearchaeota archaeon]
MKRVVISVLIILLSIPLVSASITLTGPTNAQYSVGESIDTSGFIQETNAVSGDLQLSLVCGSKTYSTPKTAIDISAGSRVSFSQLSLPTITGSSSMKGICKIRADIIVSGSTTESATSSTFELTNGLDGSFSVDKSQIQLGDSVTLTGNAYLANGDPLDGTAEVYFNHESQQYLMGFASITNGALDYTTSLSSSSAGKYTIDLIVRDSYGNEQTFKSVDTFTVLDTLDVTGNTNAESVLPGDTINVYGDVTTSLQEFVNSGTITITFDGAKQSTSLGDSKYTQDLVVPATIKSGAHTITIEVKDNNGNHGSASMVITVEAKPTSIANVLSNTTLNPEEDITIGVNLLDQAGDATDSPVVLEVYDTLGKMLSQKDMTGGSSSTYEIPKFAPPGEWKVRSYVDDGTSKPSIEADDTFTINEIQKLDYRIEFNILYITNVGNVRYTGGVEIPVEGVNQSFLIQKTKNLGVNETISIDLAKELPSGTYTLSIPTGYSAIDKKEITIDNGTPRSSINWAYTALAVLFMVGLAYLIYARIRKPEQKSNEPGERPAQGKKPLTKKIRLYDPKREEASKKKVSLTFDDKEHSLADFKQRTLEEIKRTEEKIASDSKKNRFISEGKLGYVTGRNDTTPKSKEEKPSVFKLFDE